MAPDVELAYFGILLAFVAAGIAFVLYEASSRSKERNRSK
jgi:hypothetical protein